MLQNFYGLVWEILKMPVYDAGSFNITLGVVVAASVMVKFAFILWGRFTNYHFMSKMDEGMSLYDYTEGFGFLQGDDWVDDAWDVM